MTDPIVHPYPDLEALSHAAAEATVRVFADAAPDAPLSLVLSGGSTPRRYHTLLATTYRDAVPWERVHIFWGDERFVPHDHPDSNFRMAQETLLQHVPVPPSRIHAMPTDAATPAEAAAAYEADLRAFFAGRAPAFDLVLLGLGDDGHTASLFPGTAALDESERWAVDGEAPPSASSRARVTLTYPVLNASRNVFFLVTGNGKRAPLHAILNDPDGEGARYPAAHVRPANGVHWFVDRTAYGPAPERA